MIKVCGLHRPEDLELAENLGADVLGMIYGVPESPRNNHKNEIEALLKSAKKAKTALLFRNASDNLLWESLKSFQFDILHLCGKEDSELRTRIKNDFPSIEIWQSYGIAVDNGYQKGDTEQILNLLNETNVSQVVLDAKKSGLTGGTGCLLPFEDLQSHLGDHLNQIVIAGGLTPYNVKEAIKNLKPKGVDLSSGLESTPGQKDPDKLEAFFKNIRN